MSNIPADYKRSYTTWDNVAMDPADEVWVPIQDVETGNFEPQVMTAKQAEDKGQRFYFADYSVCFSHCEDINIAE